MYIDDVPPIDNSNHRPKIIYHFFSYWQKWFRGNNSLTLLWSNRKNSLVQPPPCFQFHPRHHWGNYIVVVVIDKSIWFEKIFFEENKKRIINEKNANEKNQIKNFFQFKFSSSSSNIYATIFLFFRNHWSSSFQWLAKREKNLLRN